MKQFFNKILEKVNSLFNNGINKHQKCLMLFTLLFGILCGIVFGTLFTAFLMLVFALIAELCYCFVPTKTITFHEKEFKVPNLKEFFVDYSDYIMLPKHKLEFSNFYYVVIVILLFIILKIVF